MAGDLEFISRCTEAHEVADRSSIVSSPTNPIFFDFTSDRTFAQYTPGPERK